MYFPNFLGKLTAGLPCAVIVTCLFYGAISGSGPATVAAVGSMTIPILIELGYDKDFFRGNRSRGRWSWSYYSTKYSVYHVRKCFR